MARILFLQNDPETPPGLVGQAVAAAGCAAQAILLHQGDSPAVPADAAAHDGLVVLGGPMAAWEDRDYPALSDEVALIRAFAAADKPVLGICLGAQLIARAAGARVYRHDRVEIGFPRLTAAAGAADDPLLGGLGAYHRILQWHEDSFDLPAGATLLMTGTACRHQAFRLGRATYGFQGHFEVDRALAGRWLDCFGEALDRHRPGYRAIAAAEFARYLPAAGRFAATVTERWLRLVAGRPHRA